MTIGANTAMAAETGTTSDGFRWVFDNGVMAITGYTGTASVVNIPSIINEKAVTMIFNNAFSLWGNDQKNIDPITEVVIPDTVRQLGNQVFYKCPNLKKVTMTNSVTTMGDSVFAGCTALTEVKLSGGLTAVSTDTFGGCTSLVNITIPSPVATIGNASFKGCTALKTVTFPNTVTKIGAEAFYGCSAMTSVTIPNSVSVIEAKAFGYYVNATNVEAKVAGFAINGHFGTKAEGYAKDNAFTFNGTVSNLADVAQIKKISSSSCYYSGAENRPSVTVKYLKKNSVFPLGGGDNRYLKLGVDFTVSYANNIEPGTATLTVTGINHYTGTLQKTFTIKKAKIFSLKPVKLKVKAKPGKVTVSWKRRKRPKSLVKKVRRVEIQYSTDPTFQTDVHVKWVGRKRKKTSVRMLPPNTVYYFRIRYGAKNGVSQWSIVKPVLTQ